MIQIAIEFIIIAKFFNYLIILILDGQGECILSGEVSTRRVPIAIFTIHFIFKKLEVQLVKEIRDILT
jgi:hypothetical protein